jgi:hypothetical protein
MRLSFWPNVVLGLVVTVCGAMSSINLYFAIPATLAGIILLWGNITTHRRGKADFREKIASDAVGYLEAVLSYPFDSKSLHGAWLSKDEDFRSDALDPEACGLWKQFYDCVEARDRYFSSSSGFDTQARKVNESCFDIFWEVCARIPWVKELQGKRIDELLERKKHISLG